MKNVKCLNVKVSADTDTLSLKLRAIAKHTLALADELDKIDSETCELCGSHDVEVVTFNGNGEELTAIKCMNVECGT